MEANTPDPQSKILPPPGEHVMVHCPEFSCLGYLDEAGTWKNVFTNEKLTEVVDFSALV